MSVVISGGAVAEIAMHFLDKYKIMVIKIGSKFELRRVCKTLNAISIIRAGPPMEEELGHCDSITVDELAGQKLTVGSPSSAREGYGLVRISIVRAVMLTALAGNHRGLDLHHRGRAGRAEADGGCISSVLVRAGVLAGGCFSRRTTSVELRCTRNYLSHQHTLLYIIER